MSVPAPRTSPLAGLGVTSPVLAAPMAGGPTTAALVTDQPVVTSDPGDLSKLDPALTLVVV